VGRSVPPLDEQSRRRLRVRFGEAVDPWLDEVPGVLTTLGERWGLEFGALVPHGSMSVIVRCTTADGRAAVLKTSPDRERLGREAEALSIWTTPHVPEVLETDAAIGALLIEAIEPGRMLSDTAGEPSMESVGELVGSLHVRRSSAAGFPPLAQLITSLFDSGVRQRQLHPELVELVPHRLFERARSFAVRLAAQPSPTDLLHGDLTPVNVLDGGEGRGLVAIDPSPCVGDPAYDTIDLLVWRAGDVNTIEARAAALATAAGVDGTRILDWSVAFAAMFALDLAGPGQRHDDNWRDQAEPLLQLALQVPIS
jgi:streptomycin 6-kinase